MSNYNDIRWLNASSEELAVLKQLKNMPALFDISLADYDAYFADSDGLYGFIKHCCASKHKNVVLSLLSVAHLEMLLRFKS